MNKNYETYLQEVQEASHYRFEPNRPLGILDQATWYISRPLDRNRCPIRTMTARDLDARGIIYRGLTVEVCWDWNEVVASWTEPPQDGRKCRRSYHAVVRPFSTAITILTQNDHSYDRRAGFENMIGSAGELQLEDVFYRHESLGKTNNAAYRRGQKDKMRYSEPREPDNPLYMDGFLSKFQYAPVYSRRRALSSYGQDRGRILSKLNVPSK